ncbi:P-type DNA transfer protein VirB5 [Xanthomonas oryzae pv. oryzae]|uniref:P-type DNA transfer protein VirB5 n=1 Tax=Xanthomonas TaxID=338 RepID=UPI000859AA03|nr:P-type DNA transfer protein VirB5 [Xanthomonas oryzae]AOS01152.1 type IV secretion system protein VirB5 [Xanthomonas oryzae pv. oryzae]AOS17760.1 type IV secretion system protein VirB5 [Xanthomonas oryzae pv. oryzae]AOS21910.1 type IV secretion system protein VirB5 [Xanthomonas oryzae pv. oryzae]AOS26081.1 type IV secretion system protein VirB5 [Xanthomonas oryzae pv. oryzae]AOS30249.1 type IV secretion system protein VirB5 [Xanthomonas oryzae pv. oryzae]
MQSLKTLAVITVACSVFLSNSTYAQIPVTDGASIAQQVAAQVETIAKWKMQYDQMTSQINQMKQQYESLTGSRNLGQILNNAALRDYLPNDWQGVYDAVKSGGYSGLSGRALSIYEGNKAFDACAHFKVADQRTACEAQAVKGAQDKAFALDAYDKAKSRLTQIDQLMAKINDTPDPKAIAELQGRIAVEQAMIQNEQTKLQMYQMVAAAEDRLQEQRQRELNAKAGARRGWIQPQVTN